MRKALLLLALGATALATTVAPATQAPQPARTAEPVQLRVTTAPWEPTPLKPQAPAPVVLSTQSRRRRRVLLFVDREPLPDYRLFRPISSRYNRPARRHARNGWRRSGHN